LFNLEYGAAPAMPLAGLSNITEVQGCGAAWGSVDAAGLLGRVEDGLGNPLDGGPLLPPPAITAAAAANGVADWDSRSRVADDTEVGSVI